MILLLTYTVIPKSIIVLLLCIENKNSDMNKS